METCRAFRDKAEFLTWDELNIDNLEEYENKLAKDKKSLGGGKKIKADEITNYRKWVEYIK